MANPNQQLMWFGFIAVIGVGVTYIDFLSPVNRKSNLFEECLENVKGSTPNCQENDQKLLCLWLQDSLLLHQSSSLSKFGLHCLEDAFGVEDSNILEELGVDGSKWSAAKQSLLHDHGQELENFKNLLAERLQPKKSKLVILAKELLAIVLGLFAVGVVFGVLQSLRLFLSNDTTAEFQRFFLECFSNRHALANNAVVTFHWEEPCLVGNTVSFTVQFFQRWTGDPYPISDADSIRIHVRQGANLISAAVDIGGVSPSDVNQAKVTFTVRRAGQYHIEIYVGSTPLNGSPFMKQFLPGPPDAAKTTLVRPTSMTVCTAGVPHSFYLEPRDEYGNLCSWLHSPSKKQKAFEAFSVESFNIERVELTQPIIDLHWREMRNLTINVTFNENGIYLLRIKYHNVQLNKAEFNVIALTREESKIVEKDVVNLPSYAAKLVSLNGELYSKSKKVYCHLSPKQIAIKEYFLGFIPSKLATFRLSPSTKLFFPEKRSKKEVTVLTIEDSDQKALLTSEKSHLIAAAFALYLIKNIGGSDTFKDKQSFFYQRIYDHHQKKIRVKQQLRIDRRNLLKSSMTSTKFFSTSDWCKNFEIVFIGEEGLDWGGLRREWIELLCVTIFDRRNSGLFTSFSDDAQALVHPNPKMPAAFKLKHYEFAGRLVGKCLYESCLGSTYRQLVKARFTRSFLAQLIGLRVHYKCFEQDDPEFYLSKVKYIEENDVTDMELTFSEEEYDNHGHLLKVVDLVPGGSHLVVNQANKLLYLDALAQHRLVNPVKDQVGAFVRGLNELVPDNLLSIFDENELELLVCGTSEYSVAELRSNHVEIGSSREFNKVMSWFWIAVSNFGSEELSRLLQFTTGSSQLPPGGLAELMPRFQISASPSFGSLPTAHTCFNQLCLPDYESYELFEKALLLAIKEGSEGFGLT